MLDTSNLLPYCRKSKQHLVGNNMKYLSFKKLFHYQTSFSLSLLAFLCISSHIIALSPTVKAENADKPAVSSSIYSPPKLNQQGINLLETFDSQDDFTKNWIPSSDSQYQGKWELASSPDRPSNDKQLLLPLKARHYGISAKLQSPFSFSEKKPLVVQYEVQYREGLDCGGSYVKLIKASASQDLSKLTDKTPFTVMFGPDRCGSESKIHLIFQIQNPKTLEYEEKSWKSSKLIPSLLPIFSDKKHHLIKVIVEPNNKFEVYLDDNSVGKGNLLEDLDPPINPPKEIVDKDDEKPEDWDERTHIDDPDAKKPDDWDDNAPKTIPDPNAVKPSDWLENEPKMIPDPNAKKPEDWEEIDGEWQAPLIDNPVCADVSNCGPWNAPEIPNPNFRGKWKPPRISNPNYKGKWEPRMIANPDYFVIENPFANLEPIGAAAFELWSMADNVAFDNFILSSEPERAEILKLLTWQEKKADADASSESLWTRGSHYLKTYPWLWVVVMLCIALPAFLIISYCCDYKRGKKVGASNETAARKKTDEPRPNTKESDCESEDDVKEKTGEQDDDEDVEEAEEVTEVADDTRKTSAL